jgi:hypothetical protein
VGFVDAIWHLLNFAVPALGVAVGAAVGCKLLWRRELAPVSHARLAVGGAAGGLLALLVGLAVFGRDGLMASYGLLLLCCGLSQWWLGFGPGRR